MMFDICPVCNSKAVIFDAVTGETLCSSCGIVLRNNLEATPEPRKYCQVEIESKSRTGMSLAFHDMGLSTLISNLNVNANGVPIS